jgi:hypothetical protein
LVGTPDFRPNRFKKRLKSMRRKFNDSLNINEASERFLNFLIEDFLDLQQLRTNNFRRIDSTFEVSQPIKEVIRILSFKAKYNAIKLE